MNIRKFVTYTLIVIVGIAVGILIGMYIWGIREGIDYLKIRFNREVSIKLDYAEQQQANLVEVRDLDRLGKALEENITALEADLGQLDTMAGVVNYK